MERTPVPDTGAASFERQPSGSELWAIVDGVFERTGNKRDNVRLSCLWLCVSQHKAGASEPGDAPKKRMRDSRDLAQELRDQGYVMYLKGGVNHVRGIRARTSAAFKHPSPHGAVPSTAAAGHEDNQPPREETWKQCRKKRYNASYYAEMKDKRLLVCAVKNVIKGMNPIPKTMVKYGWDREDIRAIRSGDEEYLAFLERKFGVRFGAGTVGGKTSSCVQNASGVEA